MVNTDPIEHRVFELTSGAPASIPDIETRIAHLCHYVKHAVVEKTDHEYTIALIFPDKKLFDNPDYVLSPGEGCFCPRSMDELGKCLAGCLKNMNQSFRDDSLKIHAAAIVNHELSDEGPFSRELTLEKYHLLLEKMSRGYMPSDKEIYYIKNM